MAHYVALAFRRHFEDLAQLLFVWIMQALGVWAELRPPSRIRRPGFRRLVLAIGAGSAAAALLMVLLGLGPVERNTPGWVSSWGRGFMMAWAMFSVFAAIAVLIRHLMPQVRPEYNAARRSFLRTANVALLASPPVAMGYGMFIERTQLRMREEQIRIPGLAGDLDGLRIVQLTDIHMSPFLSERELDRAVAMANETRAHLALVTGDFISGPGDPLDLCLKRLATLRADAGIFGCLGNHEIYANVQNYATAQAARLGIRILRSESAALRFGRAYMNLAGVDYQHFKEPYLVGAERMLSTGTFNLLLSHNPDVFPVAAAQGWDLTISGHTHGGQVRVEILHQDLNIARFFTPYVDGVYQDGASSIFVSRGIGTIGLPVRLGAPPEVALLHLCPI